MIRRYNSFGSYIKKRFGITVYKVNVDAGFTCPNRDGTISTSGCIFCNNDSFRPNSCTSSLSISEQIKNGMVHIKKRYKAEKFLVYFQPYTNTYAPVNELERLYREALSEPSVIGLAIGTRPDTVDKEKIELLESLSEKYFILIEYGMQSIYEKTLEFINRGHTYSTFLKTLDLTKGRGIFIGAHVIVGFPTETREEMLSIADEVSHIPIDFLKIHQLQVIKNTPLEIIYKKTPFHVFGYEEYLEFVTEFIERLSPRIVLQRLFATAPDSILIAPHWGKMRQEILRDIEKRFELKNTYQGKKMTIHAKI
ncbi:MAG: TIGR01212 family radical SAM protein [Nitrospirae bacterium RBG_13_39_12]|nr:MAG: TIGR01212 family radical SAM protein [Nitrospirae bacterium RBG_13_39_12]